MTDKSLVKRYRETRRQLRRTKMPEEARLLDRQLQGILDRMTAKQREQVTQDTTPWPSLSKLTSPHR